MSDRFGDFISDDEEVRGIVADLAMADPISVLRDGSYGCPLCDAGYGGECCTSRELFVHDDSCVWQRAVNHRNRHATTPGVK